MACGVSLDVYRARIGSFANIASRLSCVKTRSTSSTTHSSKFKVYEVKRFVLRLSFFILFLAVVLDLTRFGDIEQNPGPDKESTLVYNFHEIGADNFEQLASTVLSQRFGINCLTFSKGRDGGRDAVAIGVNIRQNDGTVLKDQNVVVQVKHTSVESAKLDDKTRKSVFEKEKDKVKKLVGVNQLDTYIIVTNYRVPGGQFGKLVSEFTSASVGAKHVIVIGYETLSLWLYKSPDLRRDIAGLYGVGNAPSLDLLKHYKDELKLVTHVKAFTETEKLLEDRGLVFVTGQRRSGKTTVGKFLADKLSREYGFFHIVRTSEFTEKEKKGTDLFFVDDVDQEKMKEWCDLKDELSAALKKGSKFVFIGSTAGVYEFVKQKSQSSIHRKFYNQFYDGAVDLSEQFSLSCDEKREMLTKHIKKGDNEESIKNALLEDNMLQHASERISCACFPEVAYRLGSHYYVEQFMRPEAPKVYNEDFLNKFFQWVEGNVCEENDLTETKKRKAKETAASSKSCKKSKVGKTETKKWKAGKTAGFSKSCKKSKVEKTDCPVDEFAENMKSLILRTTETQEKLLNSPEIPNMKVDDIYTNMVIQLGRVKYDFQEMGRSKVLRSYPVPNNIPIERAEDLFLPIKTTEKPKSILIRGRAGIGKTLFSQMLIRDWAKGKLFSEEKNKSKFEFVFLFTFRQLNLIKRPVTLHEFLSICSFCPEMTDETFKYIVRNPESILFVFDGLDEFKYQFEINYVQHVPRWKIMSVAAVFANIAAGKLLTNATVVITTRPEAEKNLDELKVQRDVEILGFTPSEVEVYISKFFASTESRRKSVLDHILGNENLTTFCYVPVHCFLACSYLDYHLGKCPTSQGAELPSTITELYEGVVRMFSLKHHTECRAKKKSRLSGCVQSTLDKLSELSLEFLKCRKFTFSDKDLHSYGVNEEEVSQLINSGLIHCIPGCRTGPFTIESYYCFLHLTLQEFLAARCLIKTLVSLQSAGTSLSETLEDLSDVVTVFVAGFLGTAAKQSRKNLTDFSVRKEDANRSMDSIVNFLYGERSMILLIKVLYEYGDSDFAQKVLREHELNDLTIGSIADTDCQALAFLLMTEVEAECQVKILNLYSSTELSCRGVRYIKEALCSKICQVEDLYLGLNNRPVSVSQTMMQLLSEALKLKNCHLVKLSIRGVRVDNKAAENLSGALSSPECHLTKLDLSDNQISDKGTEYLSGALSSTECHLTVLYLGNNQISDKGAEYLSGGLSSPECHLTKLYLGINQIGDKGAEYLSCALSSPECHLTELDLSSNQISDKGAEYLSGALTSSECHLTKLDLSSNQICDKGAEYLNGGLTSPECHLTELDLSKNQISDKGAEYLSGALTCPECDLTELDLSNNQINDKGAEYLSGALTSPECHLTELNLRNNQINDKGAKYLSGAFASPECHLTELYLLGNNISVGERKNLRAVSFSFANV